MVVLKGFGRPTGHPSGALRQHEVFSRLTLYRATQHEKLTLPELTFTSWAESGLMDAIIVFLKIDLNADGQKHRGHNTGE